MLFALNIVIFLQEKIWKDQQVFKYSGFLLSKQSKMIVFIVFFANLLVNKLNKG